MMIVGLAATVAVTVLITRVAKRAIDERVSGEAQAVPTAAVGATVVAASAETEAVVATQE